MGYPIAVGDEAGETGFRFGRGSTDYFVYSLILTADAERLRDQLHWLRRKIGWAEREEISFNKASEERRHKFFEGARPFRFVVRSLVVDKRKLVSDFQQMVKHRFFSFFVTDLLARLPQGELEGTILILDRFNGASSAIRELRRNMREKNISGIRRITTRRSHSEVLIQLADMCAGATLREANTGQSFHAVLKDRTLTWPFGEQNPPS